MFRNARLGTKITLGVSLILLLLLFSSVGAYVYTESRRIDEDIRNHAGHVLGVLESTHIQAMLNRGHKDDNNPVLNALNGTIDQFNESSKNVKLWLVMGPKVLAFQQKARSEEVEPPQDDIDREAIETGTPVHRMAADDIFRVTRPVILGQGMAADKKCLECHGKDMGLVKGDVIGAYSVSLSVKERRAEFVRNAFLAFLGALGVSVVVLVVNAGLIYHMAGVPLSRMTRVMANMAEGDLDEEIPDLEREDEIGAMAQALGVFREHARERRRAEDELRKTRDELEIRVEERTREFRLMSQRERAVLEHAAEGIITSDEDGLIEIFNPMAERMFGYKAEEVIGKNLNMLMDGNHTCKHDDYIQNFLKTGEGKILDIRERELFARHKSGGLFQIELNVAEFHLDDQRRFIGTLRDITQRKKAREEARRRTEDQGLLQAVAQAANEARTVEVAIEACLKEVCAHTGWSVGHAYVAGDDDPGRLVSSKLWYFDDPERFETFRQVTEKTAFIQGEGLPGKVFSSGEAAWIGNTAKNKNFPRIRKVEDIGVKTGFAFPVPVQGRVGAVLEFFSDEIQEIDEQFLQVLTQIGIQVGQVIERNKALEQLAQAMEETEAANKAKTDFLANMSHELRTPLNSILGFSEVVRDEVFGALGNPRYTEYIADIHYSGEHLLNLINDILDVSKVEAGAMDLSEEIIDVKEIVQDSMKLVEGHAEEVEVGLMAEIDENLPRLRADSVRVKQILINLLNNSVKFTPGGGTITVEAGQDAKGDLLISIVDTGVGIAEDEIKDMLEPFTQASSGITKRHEGTGLGLYLVKMLVEEHGGLFEIESTLGEGTKVTVRFPSDRVIDGLKSLETPENVEKPRLKNGR